MSAGKPLGRNSRYVIFAGIFLGGLLAGSVATLLLFENDSSSEQIADQPSDRPQNLRDLSQLASLPYLSGVAPAKKSERGVVLYDRDNTWDGLNFFNCGDVAGAFLLDMEGRRIHEWSLEGNSEGWDHAELLPSGEVLVLIDDQRLMRLGPSGELRWEYQAPVHHDLSVAGDGRIFAVARQIVRAESLHPKVPVFADEIHVLSPDGALVDRISILEALYRSPYAYLLPSSQDLEPDATQANLVLDVLHTNHVQFLDGSFEHLSPLFRGGNLLVSMRTINSIGILDPTINSFVWLWGPTNISRQHHPTLLPSGNVVLFDNGQSASQIIEFDVLRGRVAWRYAPIRGFFSQLRGSVQRLPNGNTLVTESDPGVVFEVTRSGKIVWRYLSPFTTEDGLRKSIWRMTRFAPGDLEFLDRVQTP